MLTCRGASQSVEIALPSGYWGAWMTSASARSGAEDELLARIAQADTHAFETLYQEYGSAVYSLAFTLLRDGQAAQEVAQEVFLAIWRGAREFDPQRGTARTWILSLAHHKGVDAVRRQRMRANRPLEEGAVGATTPDISGEVLERVVGEQVRAALQTLSREHREAIVLAYYGGYTQQEIAKRLSVPLGTVKTRIRDGMIRLRSLLAVTARETDS